MANLSLALGDSTMGNAHQVPFDNGYAASICIGMYANGEFNVAVVDLSTGELCYDTSVTSDTVRCIDFDDMVATVEKIKALPKRLSLEDRLESEDGLCTSVAKDDEENAKRIKCILDAYLSGKVMERSHRAGGEWADVDGLPDDFGSYRYRVL